MIRLPPRSTRTDTLFPYTTLFRSCDDLHRPDACGHRLADIERPAVGRSEEHTSELQSLMRISYAVFCLKKKNNQDKISSITAIIIVNSYINYSYVKIITNV